MPLPKRNTVTATAKLHPEIKTWIELECIRLTKQRGQFTTFGDVVAILAAKAEPTLNVYLDELGIEPERT